MQVMKQKKSVIRIIILIMIINCFCVIQPVYANQDEVLESQKESLNISYFIR